MPEYLSPGVYVEEIDAGPKPIEGVSTSTAGAVGVTARGPTTGKPELVTSFAEFQRKFGGFLTPPPANLQTQWEGNAVEGGRWWHFPLAVKGFFDNGGQRLYVKRVFSRTAVAANAPLARGLVAEVERDVAATAANAEVTVGHLFGIQNGTQLTLRNGETGQTIGGVNAFAVTSYDATTRRIVLNAPLPPNTTLEATRGDTVEIATPTAVAGVPFTARAKARGAWGNDIRVRVRPSLGATLTLLHDPVNGGAAARARVAALAQPAVPGPWLVTVQATVLPVPPALTGFANGDHVVIDGREYAIAAMNLGANTFEIAALPPGTQWSAGTAIQRLRLAHQGATAQLRMWGASQLDGYANAVLELDNGTAKEVRQVVSVAGDVVTLSANIGSQYFEGHRIRVVEIEVSAQYRPNNRVELEEIFTNLRLVGAAGDPQHASTRLAQDSKLIELDDGGVAQPATPLTSLPIALTGRWMNLANGNDNLGALDPDAFVGSDGGSGNRTGIQSLEDIDEVSICMVPGMWSRTVHNALIQHCEILKDRFAIVDPRHPLDIEGVRSFREIYDTKYAALYYPWIELRDPSTRQDVVVAPSAHMAGIYARVDVERGVHKAPGNEVIRGISRIAQDVTKREQDMLNPRNINVLRFFPGRGNRVWGARVVTSDSSWKYINVRRIFIYVEESIDEGTQWVVFEPNDEPTWARVRQSIANFLTTVWRSGALQGAKAEEAFFVRCDRTTMSQDDIDNGRLICLIGIAPVKPAEFVIFRIQQKTLDTQAQA